MTKKAYLHDCTQLENVLVNDFSFHCWLQAQGFLGQTRNSSWPVSAKRSTAAAMKAAKRIAPLIAIEFSL
jgi:hypothetical protein